MNEVMMELASPLATSVRFHWPMQGPQLLDSTVPPILSNTSIMPSRAMVARICSLPGEMVNGTLALMPAAVQGGREGGRGTQHAQLSYDSLLLRLLLHNPKTTSCA